ncbi:uncharacterized protein LOC132699985 [Cylas formicarius]|uniref:uncharacterized protein LOC132699985 n=1 Tax=Cylas formicarius TaxID=197179 RepID=UPI0029585809|nr:uncharacterized protein LOC132699985 [Cylas formicarius]
MLIATPYRDFDVRDKSPPKVISEVRKTYLNCSAGQNLRPRLTGELLVKCGQDKLWWRRRVQVRSGQLQVFAGPGGDGPSLRLPLRHLSLQAGPLPHSLALCRGQNVILTLETPSEHSFDQWIKTIAIELIRQTPLDAIKYLDILTLAECWYKNKEGVDEKDWNQSGSEQAVPACEITDTQGTDVKIEETPTKDEEEVVEDLLKKCQNVENYVPVKEKLFLFESLCKMGRKVRSSEDVSLRVEKTPNKRAKSLHDLSNLNSHIAVREICKYFETKCETVNTSGRQQVNAPLSIKK